MRVKTGNTRKDRHKKVLQEAKGYRMTKSKIYKVAHEATMHAGQYSYAHRRRKHSQMKTLWTRRINAAARNNGLTYSNFINKLKKNNIKLNRKVLSDIGLNHPKVFSVIVEEVKK